MRTLGTLLLLCLTAPVLAQPMAVSTTDGTVLVGEIEALLGGGVEANLRVTHEGKSVSLPLARVLAVHGPAPAPSDDTAVFLVGGDELRGSLQGGDAAGETFTVRSRSLGDLRVPVDRLRAVVFGAGADADPSRFEIPDTVEEDEALFRKARRGYDTILGAIHRFTPTGVLFEWERETEPRLSSYDSLAAIALRGGLPAERSAGAQLVTRAGDVLSIDLVGIENGRFVFDMEGERRASVEAADVSALTFLSNDRRYLSDLEPMHVEERGTPFEEVPEPLYGYATDRAAAGGFLVVGEQTHGKGLGTHSRCILTFEVPPGYQRFLTQVGIDDQVLGTPVRGVAEVRVLLDGEVLWGPQTVRSGAAARSVGPLAVRPGGELTLEVDFGDGWFVGDRVDWLSPVLMK